SAMTGVRLRLAHRGPDRSFLQPGFDACRAAAHEFIELDHAIGGPHAVRAAKVRDPGFSRDACAREADDALGFGHQFDGFGELHVRPISFQAIYLSPLSYLYLQL